MNATMISKTDLGTDIHSGYVVRLDVMQTRFGTLEAFVVLCNGMEDTDGEVVIQADVTHGSADLLELMNREALDTHAGAAVDAVDDATRRWHNGAVRA